MMTYANGDPDNCYDPVTHDCDGRCQGATDCSMARWINGLIKRKPSRKRMIKEFEDERKQREAWEEFLRSDEGKRLIAEIAEEIKKFRRNVNG